VPPASVTPDAPALKHRPAEPCFDAVLDEGRSTVSPAVVHDRPI
jgi:hypothetical protein